MNYVVRFALAAVLVAAAIGASAASSGSRRGQAARPKVVVLDFSLAPMTIETRDENRQLVKTDKPVETSKQIRGWWLGGQNVYYNANMGRIAADLFSSAIREGCTYDVISRENLKYYYADKRDVLRKTLKLDEKQANDAILQLDPLKVGREVGADKVVVGAICDSERRHSRASGYYATVSNYTVRVLDVRTGAEDYSTQFVGYHGHQNPYGAFEADAAQFASQFAGAPAN